MADFSQFTPAVKMLLEYGNKLVYESTEGKLIRAIIKRNPAFFVLCCVADKNVDASIAWKIPDLVPYDSFAELEKITEQQWQEILTHAGYNRPIKVSKEYVLAIRHMREKYDGHADKIWTESKSFAEIIVKFLEFQGVGKKIATMAANMLHRYANVGDNFLDEHFMDISPDTHVKQIFNKLGFVDNEHKNNTDIIVYMARALNPTAPYKLDYPCFYIGKNYCKKRGVPHCQDCPLGPKKANVCKSPHTR